MGSPPLTASASLPSSLVLEEVLPSSSSFSNPTRRRGMFRRRRRFVEAPKDIGSCHHPVKDKTVTNSSSTCTSSSNSTSAFGPLRTFFRLASHSTATTTTTTSAKAHPKGSRTRRQRKKNKNKDDKQGLFGASSRDRSGLRRSTSTHLTRSTATNRSSNFLFEPVTMSAFLLAEELAAFDEESKQEEQDGELDASSRSDDLTVSLPPCSSSRTPPPESYFEMKRNQDPELGNIQFEFDSLPDACEEAARRQRPILCIEAELPGDVTAGETIFSHPLVVEAAESLFVTVHPRPLEPQDYDVDDDDNHLEDHPTSASPCCPYDRRFFCNSSCRTRVRILDEKGIDVLAPVEHMTLAEVVSALVRGLESYRTHVPQYLRLLCEEEAGKLQVLSKTRFREVQGQAMVGIFDSVLAEVELAGLDGVLSTRSGALVRQRVVQVTYDTRRLSYGALVRHALRRTGATVLYYRTNDERIAAQLEVQHFSHYRMVQQRYADNEPQENDNDNISTCSMQQPLSLPDIKVSKCLGNVRANPSPKPALRNSILRFVPLTGLQATRANRLIHYDKFNEAMHLLSPRQGLIAMQAMRAHHSKDFQNVVDVPIGTAWNELSSLTGHEFDTLCYEKLHYVVKEDDDDDDDNTESLTEDGEDPLLQ